METMESMEGVESSTFGECEMFFKVKKSLNFNNFLKVVLIPCRDEFRKAQCDLWWSGTDFLNFKQAAKSEIKMLAVFENICMTEARQKLYQPNSGNTSMEDAEEAENDVYYRQGSDSESPPQKFRKTPVLSERKSLRTVSSVVCMPKVNSIPSFDSNEFYLDSEAEYSLSLCVPLEEPAILSTKERPSKRNPYATLYNTLIMILTLLSFSLPLVGYYLLFFY